jgi:hypothetical protein
MLGIAPAAASVVNRLGIVGHVGMPSFDGCHLTGRRRAGYMPARMAPHVLSAVCLK